MAPDLAPRRSRWLGLIVVWGIVAVVLYCHAALCRDYVNGVDRLGTHAELPSSLSSARGAFTPMAHVLPTTYADAQMWVRHALALAQGTELQLRHTGIDNAPNGRDVHWNSGFAWSIALAGRLRQVFTGEPLPAAIEQVLPWFNAPVLLAVLIVFSAWLLPRVGAVAAALVVFLLLGQPDFYVGFSPYYVDHHGLLAAAVFGLLLGAIFMGIGFGPVAPAPELSPAAGGSLLPVNAAAGRSGAVLSAVCGAVGMGVSAATLIPALVLVGVAAGIAILAFGRRACGNGTRFVPAWWRLWGRVGAGLCVVFYLLEYAPTHLGWRLEVNHPVYALAWWGGSELIALLGEWRCGLRASRTTAWRWVGAGLALAAPAVVIGIGGDRVFVVFDPFVTRLSTFVLEGLSLPQTIATFGWVSVAIKAPVAIAVVVFGVFLVRRARPAESALAAFVILVVVALGGLAIAQTRWWITASGATVCLILLGFGALTRWSANRRALIFATATIGLVSAPVIAVRLYGQVAENRAGIVEPADRIQPLYRDIANRIRASQPTSEVVLLASPNASGAISYYGGFKCIGTLYWENLAGTKAAAEMFSAQSEPAARRQLRQRHVTHVVMVSDSNFLGEYFHLLHPDPGPDTLENSFGYELLIDQQVPLWLEQVPYAIPSDVPMPDARVLIFATKFADDAAEALYEAAVSDVEAGRLEEAEHKVDLALARAPQSAEFWLIKAHLLLARNQMAASYDAVLRASAAANPVQAYPIYTGEALRFYQAHAPAVAAELFRRALAIQFQPTLANNLVWVLATSSDPNARNGPEALALAEPMARDRSDYLTLSGYAAALAECRRFGEAAVVAARAVEVARASGKPALVKKAEACRAAYASGRAWRE